MRPPIHAAVAALALAVTSASTAPQLTHIVVERDLPLRLSDGVTLYADVYRPEGPGRFPALLMRTPYDKEGAQQSGRLAMTSAAVRRGYVVVVQDTRGQFTSEGRFVPVLAGDRRRSGNHCVGGQDFRMSTDRWVCSACRIPARCSG